MTGRYIITGTLHLLLLCGCICGQNNPCDNAVTPVPGQLGYSVRDNSTRCEGFYQSPVSGPDFDVVSVLLNKLNYDFDGNEILHVSAPDLAISDSTQIQIHAVAIPMGVYYRMDGILMPNDRFSWPVDQVLSRVPFYPEQIGLYGCIISGGENVYVPLMVARSDDSLAMAPDDPIHFQVRIRKNFDQVAWRWRSLSNPTDCSPVHTSTSPMTYGTIIDIAIPVLAADSVSVRLDMLSKGRWLGPEFLTLLRPKRYEIID